MCDHSGKICFLFWIIVLFQLLVALFMSCLLFRIGSSKEYIQDELILIPIYIFPPDLITYYTQMQTRMQRIANAWYSFWL